MELEDGYTTGEFAKLCNVTVKTLLHYDKIGVFKPAHIDPYNKRRCYIEKQLTKFEIIKLLKDLKFSLKEIKEISFDKDLTPVIEIFKNRKNDNLKEIDKLIFANNYIDDWLDALTYMNSDDCKNRIEQSIRVTKWPEMRVLYIRERSLYTDKTSYTRYLKLKDIAEDNKIKTRGFYMGLIYDKGDLSSTIGDWELCRRVADEHADLDLPFIRTIPERYYATYIHRGPYVNVRDNFQKLAEWINCNGYEMLRPAFLVNIVGTSMVKSPEQIVAELAFPVKKV